MSILSKALKDKHYDVRMVERALNKGLMQEDEVEKNAKSISDDSDNSASLNLDALLEETVSQSKLRKTLHN